MAKTIPIYPLSVLSKSDVGELDVYLMSKKGGTSRASIDIPYRTNYYGVGICIRGSAGLKANLESYTIGPDDATAMSPQVIKQWQYMSDDFEILTVFFTKQFITGNNTIHLDAFRFFESVAKHTFKLNAHQAKTIKITLLSLQKIYLSNHAFKNEILKNKINILLYELAAVYDKDYMQLHSTLNRSQLLASEFKKLVNIHFYRQRGLKFYAEKLHVTPKHLTETMKEVTGRTAGEWIDETVILEAKVLLQNPAFSIAEISGALCFTDQSTFGKYFKNITGLSPKAFKQAL